jgi:hypothetical protein
MENAMPGPVGTATIGATAAPMPATTASMPTTDTSITIRLTTGLRPTHIAGDDTDFRSPLPLTPAGAQGGKGDDEISTCSDHFSVDSCGHIGGARRHGCRAQQERVGRDGNE